MALEDNNTAHPLRVLLNVYAASDEQVVSQLPNILGVLSVDALRQSAHEQKWIARVNSLLYSKDPGGRWAGLCIAAKSAILSRKLMIDCAQSWIGAALPLLSVCNT
jgi:hypothetical protein